MPAFTRQPESEGYESQQVGDEAPKALRRPEFNSVVAKPMTAELERFPATSLPPPLGSRVALLLVVDLVGMAKLGVERWSRKTSGEIGEKVVIAKMML